MYRTGFQLASFQMLQLINTNQGHLKSQYPQKTQFRKFAVRCRLRTMPHSAESTRKFWLEFHAELHIAWSWRWNFLEKICAMPHSMELQLSAMRHILGSRDSGLCCIARSQFCIARSQYTIFSAFVKVVKAKILPFAIFPTKCQ
jgi:hypothetical protein